MDAETAIILECHRRRRVLAAELLREIETLISPVPDPPPQRLVPARGWREVGLARFRQTRQVPSANESR